MNIIKDTLRKYASILGAGFLAVSCASNDTGDKLDLETALPPELREDVQITKDNEEHKPGDYIRETYMTRDRECVDPNKKDCLENKLEVL